jgi:hypothetical protein
MLNKQPRTAHKGQATSLGLGEGQATRHRKKPPCHEMLRPRN